MRVSRWGNNLAVRLPQAVVKALGMKAGAEVEVRVTATGSIEINRRPTDLEVVAELRKYRGLMPAGYRFDREDANRRR